MRKKVGIITFHKSLNYGSALQAWALCRAINLFFDCEPTIVDYQPNHYSELYGLFWAPTNLRDFVYNALHLLWLSYLLRRRKDFELFTEHNLPLSQVKYSENDSIEAFYESQDMMIAGSDQIWNTEAVDFDLNYVLPNCNKLKISYAASLGNSKLLGKGAETLKYYISLFDSISVREQTGRDKLVGLLGKDQNVHVDIDPTLLLSKSEYIDLIIDTNRNKPYIFFYSINFNQDTIDYVVQLSKEKNLPVVTMISGRGNIRYFTNQRKIKLAKGDAGPKGFLTNIYNASYVVTDSFHGVAFSLIFEKQFIAINHTKSAGVLKNDERILNILSKVDLLERYLSKEDAIKYDVGKEIDYDNVLRKRKKLVDESLDYLRNSLRV